MTGGGGIGVRLLKLLAGEALDLAFSPDGRALAVTLKYQPHVWLWDLDSPSPHPAHLDAGGDHPTDLVFSADGRALAWHVGGLRKVYDRLTGRVVTERFALSRLADDVVHSADGSRVISRHELPDHCLIGWRAGEQGWVRAWTVSTADLSVDRLTLSSDGRLFALLARPTLGTRWWDYPLRVEVRDAATAAVRVTAEYPSNHPARLLFSPDARQLVGFKDMTLLVWPVSGDLGSLGPPQLIRNDNRKHFTAMAFHPNGRHLFATSNDTTVHVFDTQTWERRERYRWQLGNLKAVAISPDGTLAAAAGHDGDLVIWDLDV